VGVEGVHPEKIHEVLRLKRRVVKGELDFERREGELPGIVIGKEIQKRFNVEEGEVIRLVIPVVSSRDFRNSNQGCASLKFGVSLPLVTTSSTADIF
jgi:ABC-type lipoprotein release transport system permease subunit